jgi:hypothetical protein
MAILSLVLSVRRFSGHFPVFWLPSVPSHEFRALVHILGAHFISILFQRIEERQIPEQRDRRLPGSIAESGVDGHRPSIVTRSATRPHTAPRSVTTIPRGDIPLRGRDFLFRVSLLSSVNPAWQYLPLPDRRTICRHSLPEIHPMDEWPQSPSTRSLWTTHS